VSNPEQRHMSPTQNRPLWADQLGAIADQMQQVRKEQPRGVPANHQAPRPPGGIEEVRTHWTARSSVGLEPEATLKA
jgi:hypothetical protein